MQWEIAACLKVSRDTTAAEIKPDMFLNLNVEEGIETEQTFRLYGALPFQQQQQQSNMTPERKFLVGLCVCVR